MNAAQVVDNEVDSNRWRAIATSPRLWVGALCLLMLFNPLLLVSGGRWLCSQPQQSGMFNLHPLIFNNLIVGAILWVSAIAGIFVTLIYQLFQHDRWERVWKTLLPLGAGIAGVFTLPFMVNFDAAEKQMFPRISANARPIVEALEKFKIENGEYPITLSQLVPIYLQKLPSPGVLGAREYGYRYPGRRYAYITGEREPSTYELFVRIGIEDNYFYIPDEARRLDVLKWGVFSREADDWIYENT